ncbi:MFS transporter [Corynebacterium variabile]|uniref:MFS transporter n=1 Tax=Corynebacterium variabile TaxID=1727 RepID=UPI003FD03606
MNRRVAISRQSLITANVLSDALATSMLGSGIGYLVLARTDIRPGLSMSLVGIATFLGILASFPAGILSDFLGTRRVLMIVQGVQVAVYLCLWFTSSYFFLFILASAFFLGRIVSPLRGALPPLYIDKQELIGFKSRLRTRTLAVTLLASASIPGILYLDFSLQKTVAIVGFAAYLACLMATYRLGGALVDGGLKKRPSNGPMRLTFQDWTVWLLLLGCFIIVGVAGALFPFIVASFGSGFSWLLFASSIIGIVSNDVVRRIIPRLSDSNGRIRGVQRIIWLSYLTGSMATLLFVFLLSSASANTLVISFLLLGSILGNLSEILGVVVAWDRQYTAGSDDRRSSIVAFFSLSSSLGGSIGQLFGGRVYSISEN